MVKKESNTIYAVVINYKGYTALEKTLESLSHVIIPKGYTFIILVVDQEYETHQLERLQKKFPHVIYIKERNNLGVGGAFNLGFKYGLEKHAEYFFIMPADVTMEKDILIKLLPALTQNSLIGMVCPKILLNTNPRKILFVGGTSDPKIRSTIHIGTGEVDLHQYDYIHTTDLLNCPVLLKSKIINTVGYMQTQYFMYYEDTDWYVKTKKAGFALRVVPEAIAYTDEASNNKEAICRKDYYLSRNLLYFIKDNYTLLQQLIAYCYIAKNALVLLSNSIFLVDRKRSYYKLLGMKDFIFGKIGKKEFKNI